MTAEDDKFNRMILQFFIQGYVDIDIAVDGYEAVEAFNTNLTSSRPYDFIFIGSKRTKVIMTTAALNDSHRMRETFQHGKADAYLVKALCKIKIDSKIQHLGLIN